MNWDDLGGGIWATPNASYTIRLKPQGYVAYRGSHYVGNYGSLESAKKAAHTDKFGTANPLHLPHLPHLSPKSIQTATSLAVLAGGALLVWWGLKSAKAAGPGHLADGAPTLPVVPGLLLVVPGTGAYIALPAGATWAASVPYPYGGTGTTLPVQPSAAPRTFGLDWIDAAGVAHTVTLAS